jgi:hypothetical protein
MLPFACKAKFLSWATGWTSDELQFDLWQRQDNVSQSQSVQSCCGTHKPPESKNAWSYAYTPPTHLHVVTLKNDGFVRDDETTHPSVQLILLLRFPFLVLYTATFETRNIEKYWVTIK